MAFVTVAELRTTLGIGALYTDAVLQQICDSSNLIIDEYLAKNNAYVDEQQLLSNTVTLYTADINPFVVGQVVTISGCGATFNGSKTISSKHDGLYFSTHGVEFLKNSLLFVPMPFISILLRVWLGSGIFAFLLP